MSLHVGDGRFNKFLKSTQRHRRNAIFTTMHYDYARLTKLADHVMQKGFKVFSDHASFTEPSDRNIVWLEVEVVVTVVPSGMF